jgi:hypothetical protein
MNLRLLMVFIVITIAISLARFAAGLTTIVTPVFVLNTTLGNITDGNSTEIFAPSEEGGWD